MSAQLVLVWFVSTSCSECIVDMFKACHDSLCLSSNNSCLPSGQRSKGEVTWEHVEGSVLWHILVIHCIHLDYSREWKVLPKTNVHVDRLLHHCQCTFYCIHHIYCSSQFLHPLCLCNNLWRFLEKRFSRDACSSCHRNHSLDRFLVCQVSLFRLNMYLLAWHLRCPVGGHKIL